MNAVSTVVLNVLITIAILVMICGGFHVASLMDECESKHAGEGCHLIAIPETRHE